MKTDASFGLRSSLSLFALSSFSQAQYDHSQGRQAYHLREPLQGGSPRRQEGFQRSQTPRFGRQELVCHQGLSIFDFERFLDHSLLVAILLREFITHNFSIFFSFFFGMKN